MFPALSELTLLRHKMDKEKTNVQKDTTKISNRKGPFKLEVIWGAWVA